jgi:hypothetical protein
MSCCHQRPSERYVFHGLALAPGGRSTVILNAALSDKKNPPSEKINKTKEITINPNCTRPKLSCWKDTFLISVDHSFANRRETDNIIKLANDQLIVYLTVMFKAHGS